MGKIIASRMDELRDSIRAADKTKSFRIRCVASFDYKKWIEDNAVRFGMESASQHTLLKLNEMVALTGPVKISMQGSIDRMSAALESVDVAWRAAPSAAEFAERIRAARGGFIKVKKAPARKVLVAVSPRGARRGKKLLVGLPSASVVPVAADGVLNMDLSEEEDVNVPSNDDVDQLSDAFSDMKANDPTASKELSDAEMPVIDDAPVNGSNDVDAPMDGVSDRPQEKSQDGRAAIPDGGSLTHVNERSS
jgi:hypothetical protein